MTYDPNFSPTRDEARERRRLRTEETLKENQEFDRATRSGYNGCVCREHDVVYSFDEGCPVCSGKRSLFMAKWTWWVKCSIWKYGIIYTNKQLRFYYGRGGFVIGVHDYKSMRLPFPNDLPKHAEGQEIPTMNEEEFNESLRLDP
jgi:formate-dependent nitrite reductase cytochrome c552 subunit